MSALEAPECPAGCGPLATPIADLGGGVTTDRVDGPDDSTLWCPACGVGWRGTPEDVLQASRALELYYRSEGHAPRPVRHRAAGRARQLALPGVAS